MSEAEPNPEYCPFRPQETATAERLYVAVDAPLQGWLFDEADRGTPNSERLTAWTDFIGEFTAVLAFVGSDDKASAEIVAEMITRHAFHTALRKIRQSKALTMSTDTTPAAAAPTPIEKTLRWRAAEQRRNAEGYDHNAEYVRKENKELLARGNFPSREQSQSPDVDRYRAQEARKLAADLESAAARIDAMTEALDEIASIVSYLVIHGVGDDPSPPPESGGPQVQQVPVWELGRLIDKIGNTARAARDGLPGKGTSND